MVGKVGCIIYLEELLVGFLGGSILKVDIAGAAKKTMGDFGFWIKSDSWKVYFCFSYLYNASILWKYIQGSLG